jgi:hypothetical protein
MNFGINTFVMVIEELGLLREELEREEGIWDMTVQPIMRKKLGGCVKSAWK